jgi:antirestriction protein ArdC
MATDVYSIISDRIIAQLESGTVPWRKPWTAQGEPQNLVSKRAYRGVNVFLLRGQTFESPYWLTFRQAQELKGHVRKGEHATPVVFWKWFEKEDDESGKVRPAPLLRYYSVFNAVQCDLPAGAVPQPEKAPGTVDPIEQCEQVVKAMPKRPEIRHGGDSAFYRPMTDTVTIPHRNRFSWSAEYYSTLFHELAHATGHASRLNRPGITDLAAFGTEVYSKEELVAEMSAAFLCGHCGIEQATVPNSAAYIASWLKQLKNDRRLVVHAAAAAQKAADFILDRQFVEAVE